MNKLLIIALLAAAVLAGIAVAYYLELPPAVALVDGAKAKFTELTSGGIDGQTILTGGSISTATTLGVAAYNQYKGKITAQTSAAKEAILKSDAVAQVEQLNQTKEQLTSQLTEAAQIKDSALAEAEKAKAEISSLKDQNAKLQTSIDALHELIPDMKDKDLSAIVQNALKVS
jgi:chromosome segregation ATPase